MLEDKISRVRKHINDNKKFYTGITALTLAGIADATITGMNLSRYGGIEYEGNPIVRNLMEYTGIHAGFVTSRALGLMATAGAAKICYNKGKEKIGNAILYGGTMAWSFGALSNLYYFLNSTFTP